MTDKQALAFWLRGGYLNHGADSSPTNGMLLKTQCWVAIGNVFLKEWGLRSI